MLDGGWVARGWGGVMVTNDCSNNLISSNRQLNLIVVLVTLMKEHSLYFNLNSKYMLSVLSEKL